MGIEHFGDKVIKLKKNGHYEEVRAAVASKFQAALDGLNGGNINAVKDGLNGIDELEKYLKGAEESKQRMQELFAEFANKLESEFGVRLSMDDLRSIVCELYKEFEKGNEEGEQDLVVGALPIVDSSVESETDEVVILGDTQLKHLQAHLRLGDAKGATKMSEAVRKVFAIEIIKGAKPASIYARSMTRDYRGELERELKDVLHVLRDTLRVGGFTFAEDRILQVHLSPNQYILACQLLEAYQGKSFSEVVEMLEPKRGNGELKKKKK